MKMDRVLHNTPTYLAARTLMIKLWRKLVKTCKTAWIKSPRSKLRSDKRITTLKTDFSIWVLLHWEIMLRKRRIPNWWKTSQTTATCWSSSFSLITWTSQLPSIRHQTQTFWWRIFHIMITAYRKTTLTYRPTRKTKIQSAIEPRTITKRVCLVEKCSNSRRWRRMWRSHWFAIPSRRKNTTTPTTSTTAW